MKLLIRLLVNAVALWVTAAILPGLTLEGGFFNLLLVALIFGAVNTFIKPLAKLLTLPIRVATLGLFTIVVNAFMVLLTTWRLLSVCSFACCAASEVCWALLATSWILADISVTAVATWSVSEYCWLILAVLISMAAASSSERVLMSFDESAIRPTMPPVSDSRYLKASMIWPASS